MQLQLGIRCPSPMVAIERGFALARLIYALPGDRCMSTRGAIARMTHVLPLHWAGRYHHWDSYPTGLGKELWELFHAHFERDLDKMLRVLIDEHPAGWSTITGADFRLTPGWGEPPSDDATTEVENPGCRPSCYCHGERSEEAWLVTDQNASGSGVEWAYVFTSVLARDSDKEERLCTMLVLSSYFASGEKMIGMFGTGDSQAQWKPVAIVDLQGEEPIWEEIERCGAQGLVYKPVKRDSTSVQ